MYSAFDTIDPVLEENGKLFIENNVSIVKDSRILDIGCGYGIYSSLLMQKGASMVVGIDSNFIRISYAKKNNPIKGIFFIIGDIEKIPVKSKFLHIIANSLLQYLDKPFDAIKKMITLLDYQGSIYIVYNKRNFRENILTFFQQLFILIPRITFWRIIFFAPVRILNFFNKSNKLFSLRTLTAYLENRIFVKNFHLFSLEQFENFIKKTSMELNTPLFIEPIKFSAVTISALKITRKGGNCEI